MDAIPLPDQVSELYNDLLSRCAPNEHKDWGLAITALKLLAITHRPFSILELSWAVTLHTARNVNTVDELAKLVDHKKLMSMIQPFIAGVELDDLRKYQVQLIEKSLKDLIKKNWATKYSNTECPHSLGDDGQGFRSPEALILDICVRYLLLDEIGVKLVFSEEQIAISELPQASDLFNDEKDPVKYNSHCSWEAWEEDMTRFNPTERGLGEFFVYASCYWPEYYRLVTAKALPSLASIEKLCQADSNRIRNWTQQNRRPGCAMPPRFPFDSQLYDPLSITCLYGSVDMLHVMLRDSDFDNGNFLEMTAMKAADQILQWGDMSRLRALFLDPRLGHQLRNLDFFGLIIRRWRESSVCRPDWEDAFALIDLMRDQMAQQQWGYELWCIAASAGCAPVAQRLLSGARHNDGLRRELLREFSPMPQVAPLK
ncbi:NACHT domain protein [Aspergillus neoniger CBS 115656]|uniref:NACHT domain protein n=1 Tax=Aspergillus neoniger (strain CBS 115656) TaxID=1448310 RepID=A0A318ZTP8_ASPNB|nr:NACHT domain protein [Aspergillus neoniger CBS 115656]PYH39092.1 NACHT domain protein [Aspergillus neoniger CBS 115656]